MYSAFRKKTGRIQIQIHKPQFIFSDPMKTSPPPALRMTPAEFKALAKAKGWRFTMLAARWGVTPEWISGISRDPLRDLRYDDALLGLPNLHHRERELRLRARRIAAALVGSTSGQASEHARPAARVRPGFRYRHYLQLGTIVTASMQVGSMAEEGERGIVVQVLAGALEERYGVIFESGAHDWFGPDDVDACLATTGLAVPDLSHYRYVDAARLRADFAAGAFVFWPGTR